MLLMEIIVAYCEHGMELINTLCGENIESNYV